MCTALATESRNYDHFPYLKTARDRRGISTVKSVILWHQWLGCTHRRFNIRTVRMYLSVSGIILYIYIYIYEYICGVHVRACVHMKKYNKFFFFGISLQFFNFGQTHQSMTDRPTDRPIDRRKYNLFWIQVLLNTFWKYRCIFFPSEIA